MDFLEAKDHLCPNGSLNRPGTPCPIRRYYPIASVAFICHLAINHKFDALTALKCLDFDSMLDDSNLSQLSKYFGAEGMLCHDA
jgi:hypothetical protein